LKKESDRAAERKCGKGEDNKECRESVKEEIVEKEKEFRKTSLEACGCKNHLFTDEYNKCARKCLREACKVRARVTCTGHSEETKCREEKVTRCRKVHSCDKEEEIKHEKKRRKKRKT